MFIPDWSHLQDFKEKHSKFKRRQKKDHDQRHRVRDLSPIPDDTSVWVNTRGTQTSGTVVRSDSAPRSYWLQTSSGEVRCNRRDVIVLPESTQSQETPPRTVETPNVIATQSCTGTMIRSPERLSYD